MVTGNRKKQNKTLDQREIDIGLGGRGNDEVTHLRKYSSWEYRYLTSERRATISAWQSFRANPRSLMYSPFMHLVPVETQMTSASFTSEPGRENANVNVIVCCEVVRRRLFSQWHAFDSDNTEGRSNGFAVFIQTDIRVPKLHFRPPKLWAFMLVSKIPKKVSNCTIKF